METEKQVGCLVAGSPERRAHPRHDVDVDATLLLLSQGSRIAGRLIDLGVEGCRLRTGAPFLAGIQIRVEVSFTIRGIAFRFSGVTKWTFDKQVVGIHFLNVPRRRRDELAEVLGEVEAERASKLEKESAELDPAQAVPMHPISSQEKENQQLAQLRRVQPKPASPAQFVALGPQLVSKAHSTHMVVPKQELIAKTQTLPRSQPLPDPQQEASTPPAASSQVASSSRRDRRAQSRHAVDTTAVIFLINIASQVRGRIQDLSVGGCRIQTEERFPLGIYTRVETEFRLEGLPFRLGGVIQALHDKGRHLVGIRFLDMSLRKREQVDQLIQEIEETRAAPKIAKPADAGDSIQGV